MSKDRERELLSKLNEGRHNEHVKAVVELFTLRLDKHKNNLISTGCDIIRGRAQEARDFLRNFE